MEKWKSGKLWMLHVCLFGPSAKSNQDSRANTSEIGASLFQSSIFTFQIFVQSKLSRKKIKGSRFNVQGFKLLSQCISWIFTNQGVFILPDFVKVCAEEEDVD